MRVVAQRVQQASVEVDKEVVGRIRQGLCLLVGFGQDDSGDELEPMANRIVNLRIFPDETTGRFHRSLLDVSGSILAVPQFTLYADTSKGRRPEFFSALLPSKAAPLFERFVAALSDAGAPQVATGIFGAHMNVTLTNDGPVTILLES
ncbi:MAG: D-tyrosyl-tRNA(Tyr) deacylase [Bdellovibrionales bacterium]|nr:D-tyrosyl-tRNA(Tyr) deacylase [Bdellovibrionales bacterium]